MTRPLYGVEVFDGETARFEVVLSEDDMHGQWTLNGQVLHPSAVGSSQISWPHLGEVLTGGSCDSWGFGPLFAVGSFG